MAFQIGPFQQLAPSNNFIPNGAPGVAGFAPQQVGIQSILQMLAGLMQTIASMQQGWAGAMGAGQQPSVSQQPQFNNGTQFNGPVGGNQQMRQFVPQFAPQAPRFNQFSQRRPQATGFAAPGQVGLPMRSAQTAPRQTQSANQQAEGANQQTQAANPQNQAANQQAEGANQQTQAANQQTQAANQQAEGANQQTQAANQQTQAANQQAEGANQQTQAANQQTQAANQQTQAANQQTQAANQQTQAANQQTQAANQQTQAANQQTQAANQQTQAANQQTQAANQQTQAANQQTQTGAQGPVSQEQIQSVLAALKAIDDRPIGPITNTPGVAQFDQKEIEKGNLLAGLPPELAQAATAALLKKRAVKESFYGIPVGSIILPFKLSADPAQGSKQLIEYMQSGQQLLAASGDNFSKLPDVPWVSQLAALSGN